PPPAGGDVEGPDGPLLPQQRLALPAQGRVRSAEPVQEPPRPPDLGTGRGSLAGGGEGAGGAMNRALGAPIVDAVLYEGYVLYPSRPSVKNRQRWTFGGLSPKPIAGPGVAVIPRATRRNAWSGEARKRPSTWRFAFYT